MNINEFNFELPEELIALRPASPRSSSKLLVSCKDGLSDMMVKDLPHILQEGDRLVLNDTKVISASLQGIRYRSGVNGVRVSVNLDQPIENNIWLVLVRPARRIQSGDIVHFGTTLKAEFGERQGDFFALKFNCLKEHFESLLEKAGDIPLPPYITAKRAVDDDDVSDYQTIFARQTGAVAAPTASLHFDKTLVEQLTAAGVQFTYVTLHVGAGTFLPIRTDNINHHKMHAERGEITQQAANEINESLCKGRRVIAVGTTALRLVETVANKGQIRPWKGQTNLFIKPGHKFSVVSGLMTNFHLPRTTLLVLVAALIGRSRLSDVYHHAVANRYRFFSYGDSSLLFP